MIQNEANECDNQFEFLYFVLLNGKNAENKKENLSLVWKNISFLSDESCEGKNDAVNTMIHHINNTEIEIVHLFDDDVDLKKGTLEINLKTLISATGTTRLVGSNFFVKQSSITRSKGWAKFRHKLFALPYTEDSDTNNFVSGTSYCCFLKDSKNKNGCCGRLFSFNLFYRHWWQACNNKTY